ncbi:MAG: branched-chain amino acid ABC transporter permease [Candidatus Rokubacteria bacterium]|nr:branched-chain amino acid ABC transporter permease [Candidatus Rokubacteria bacterium]
MALLVALVATLPLYASLYVVSVANITLYTILSALGVQLLIGYCGQITLGHAAFIAVGAYATAMGVLFWGLPYPVAMAVGCLLAGLWSALFGLPSARIKGFYMIMTTMAAQFITVDFIITKYVSRVGGREHYFSLPPGTITIGGWPVDSEVKVYYLASALTLLSLAGMANLLRTRVGRAWIAIRDNDIAAEALGVNVVYYKLLAFFAAGVLGGVAGAVWIPSLFFVSPEHFQLSWSVWLVGVVLIGGLGSLHGVVFGAIFVTVIPELLKFAVIPLSGVYPALTERFLYVKEAAFGLAIILFLLYEPRGLAYRWQQVKNYFNLWPFAY